MELVKHETCQQYFQRRLSEGWKCISLEGHNAVLLSPEGIRRELDLRNDVETLRPNGIGDETSIPYQEPSSGAHWEKVDEASADENATYIRSDTTEHARDLFILPAHSVGSGTINSVTIYYRMRCWSGAAYGKPSQKSGITVTDGGEQSFPASFATKSQTYTENPATSSAYTWGEIDDLQIGVTLKQLTNSALCTQVYVEVDYTLGGETYEGVATLAGVGTLSVVGSFLVSGLVTLSGGGALVAIGGGTFTGRAALVGTGGLVALAATKMVARASLAGTGILSAVGGLLRTASVALAGLGTLIAIANLLRVNRVVLSGLGTLAVLGRGIFTTKTTLAGTGGLVTLAVAILVAKATLVGAGILSVISGSLRLVLITLSGLGTLSGTGQRVSMGTAALSGLGMLVAKAIMTYGRILEILNPTFSVGLTVTSGFSTGLTITPEFKGG